MSGVRSFCALVPRSQYTPLCRRLLRQSLGLTDGLDCVRAVQSSTAKVVSCVTVFDQQRVRLADFIFRSSVRNQPKGGLENG